MADLYSTGLLFYSSESKPSIQAFYGPYSGTLDNAINQVNNGWNNLAGSLTGVPMGFKFGVIDPSDNKFTEYVVFQKTSSDGKSITRSDITPSIRSSSVGPSGGEETPVSSISIVPAVNGGTILDPNPLIATITLNGETPIEIYAPSTGSVDISDIYESENIIAFGETGPDYTFNFDDNSIKNLAPSLKLFADLAKRVAKLESQLGGHRIESNSNNTGN